MLAKDVLRATLEKLRSRFDLEPALMSQDKPEDGKALMQGMSVAIAELLTLEQVCILLYYLSSFFFSFTFFLKNRFAFRLCLRL